MPSDLFIDFATEPTLFPALPKVVSALGFGNRLRKCEANIHKAFGMLQSAYPFSNLARPSIRELCVSWRWSGSAELKETLFETIFHLDIYR